MFKSRKELEDWTRNKGLSLGYVIVTRRSKAYVNGFVYQVVLICDRGREYIAKNTVRVSGSKKTNCKFQLEGKYSKEYDQWILKVICDEHNHPPAQFLEGHPFARRLSNDETRLVEDLTRKNVASHDILSTVKEQNKDNVSTIKTIYNAQQKFRMRDRAGRTPMQILLSILHTNQYVYDFTTGDLNELENLFFIHPTSWKLLRAFPYVLIIDVTYNTNAYKKLFVQIVGVTSTQKTFYIAFSFMHGENEANYTWVLNCLKSTLDECTQPRVIITDRELALVNACGVVFPDAARLLCRWHIENNIMSHATGAMGSIEDRETFCHLWDLLVKSPTWIAYMENYSRLQSMLTKYPRVLSYIDKYWLKKYKEMFVSVWVDQNLNFGNYTTNRVESQHAKLKRFLESANSKLDRFVQRINEIVQSQVTAINQTFENSLSHRYNHHNLECFKKLRGKVSNDALDIMLQEIEMLDPFFDTSNCGCQLYNSHGLPCACMISAYMNSGQHIPLDSINIFWRKLDYSPSAAVENDKPRATNIDCELAKIKENFNELSEPEKIIYLRKIKEIYEPRGTDIEEPTVLENTRGRPSIKKQKKKKNVNPQNQVPHRSSYANTSDFNGFHFNQEPKRHSYSCGIDLNDGPQSIDPCSYQFDLNDEPIGQCSYEFDLNEETPNDPLLEEIPSVFHPYIKRIQNVDGDGNCGFRAVAVCLRYDENEWLNIRRQLLDELLTSDKYYKGVFVGFNEIRDSLDFFRTDIYAPRRHYMLMPETGILIANRYGVIVQFLSPQGCATFFPTRRGPREFPVHHVISFALLHSIHYVTVQLAEECPMPRISSLWIRHRDQSASEWETMYKSRLDFYKQLKPTETSFMVIDD